MIVTKLFYLCHKVLMLNVRKGHCCHLQAVNAQISFHILIKTFISDEPFFNIVLIFFLQTFFFPPKKKKKKQKSGMICHVHYPHYAA